jgi:hypothetical protein
MSTGTSWVQIAAVLITGVFTVIGVLVAQSRAYHYQQRAARLQNQQKAYSAIQGLRLLTNQTLVSAMQAKVDFEYFSESWSREGRPPDAWQLKQAQKCEERAADLYIEMAKVRQALAEAIGLAQANFPHTTTLAATSERLYRAPGFNYASPAVNTEPALSQWRDATVKSVQEKVDQEYNQLFGQLLDELRQLLPKPEDEPRRQ